VKVETSTRERVYELQESSEEQRRAAKTKTDGGSQPKCQILKIQQFSL
jgi:hypothetical protein